MTPDQVRAAYRRLIDEAGEDIVVRRYTGTGASRLKFDAEVRARIVEFMPEELVGDVQQGDRKAIVLAEDMEAAQVPSDIRKGDKIVVRGRELNVEAADDSTRRINGVLIAWELRVRG